MPSCQGTLARHITVPCMQHASCQEGDVCAALHATNCMPSKVGWGRIGRTVRRGGEGRGGEGRADCPDVSMGLALTTITLVTCHKHAVGMPHMA